jgi:hypothetical protein
VRELAERAYFFLCRAAGRLLRAGRYSTTRIVVDHDDVLVVRKSRRFYAPLLVSLGGPLVRILDTGVTVLPQRNWEERERLLYGKLRGSPVRTDADGTLVLPHLAGQTLATLLEDPAVDESARTRAIELAVVALVELHSLGFTHGDAMAENVMVDLEAGAAHWFDFETMHDPSRPVAWRRADDVRALLATSLLRTIHEEVAETVDRILDAYGDDAATPLLAASFTSVLRRPLTFHLGQAPLSFRRFRDVAGLLQERVGDRDP